MLTTHGVMMMNEDQGDELIAIMAAILKALESIAWNGSRQ